MIVMPSPEDSKPRFFERQELLTKRLAFILEIVQAEVPENFGKIATKEVRHLYDDFLFEASVIHTHLERGDLDRVLEEHMESLKKKAQNLVKVLREMSANKKSPDIKKSGNII